METKLFGLLVGPPWHLRGLGPACPVLGSRLPPRGFLLALAALLRPRFCAARRLRGAPQRYLRRGRSATRASGQYLHSVSFEPCFHRSGVQGAYLPNFVTYVLHT
eukprot:13781204-Alexandrium_andersonii.AAC.1